MRFFKNKKMLTILLLVLTIFIYLKYTRKIEGNNLINKNDKLYVNNLYMSDGRIYNNYLSKSEKKMYDRFMEYIAKHKINVEGSPESFGCKDFNDCFSLFSKAHYAILIDHPELVVYSSFSVIYDENLKLRFQYALPFNFMGDIGEARINRIIDDIKKKTKNMSDKDKIRYVYNWMGSNAKYDLTFTYNSKNQSLYTVFMHGTAVCAGFAKASQIILQNIGIKSYIAVGSSTGPHMWNIVEYNGKYYYFDSTVATCIKDKKSKYYYDGLNQEYMNTYTLDNPKWYPKIEKDNLFES